MISWLSVRSRVPLIDVIRGRDNNLNIIRFIAATMVLVSHSFALYTGTPETEPWRKTLGMSMGGMAVDIFFCASGFLVAGSMLASQSIRDFLVARALRIYPGLWVALVLTVLVVGFFATTASVDRYFGSFETWKYLVRNSIMVAGAEFQLPGAFAANPFRGAVNGSLWTLPFELRAYLILVIIWLVAVNLRRIIVARFSDACAVVAGLVAVWAIGSIVSGHDNKFAALLTVFLFGALARLYAKRVVLSLRVGLTIIAILTVCVLVYVKLFLIMYLFALPYLLLCIVYLPAGFIRKFNDVGDYSYGIYIYAFPVQQLLMMHDMSSVTELIVSSFCMTLVFAMISWHVIEKRALALRERTRKA